MPQVLILKGVAVRQFRLKPGKTRCWLVSAENKALIAMKNTKSKG